MPRFMRHDVIEAILFQGLVPVFHINEVEKAKQVVQACHDGGSTIVEFTNRGENAYKVFSELAQWCLEELPGLLLGAGTIVDSDTAALYINCGADYIVGPTFNRDVAQLCNTRRVLYIPGCLTPTEVQTAEAHGAEIIKLFPGSVVSHKFVKAVLGPMPQTLLMPSGGIPMDKKAITEWINSGAVAVNMGSALIKKELVNRGRYSEISNNVARCLEWIKDAKTSKRE